MTTLVLGGVENDEIDIEMSCRRGNLRHIFLFYMKCQENVRDLVFV